MVETFERAATALPDDAEFRDIEIVAHRARRALVVTTVLLRGRKTHRGILGGVRGDAVILEQSAGEFPIPFDMIKTANLEFDPREDLRREKRERKEKE